MGSMWAMWSVRSHRPHRWRGTEWEAPWSVRIDNVHHVMMHVGALSLACPTQVVVGADQALVSGTADRCLTAVTHHSWVDYVVLLIDGLWFIIYAEQ